MNFIALELLCNGMPEEFLITEGESRENDSEVKSKDVHTGTRNLVFTLALCAALCLPNSKSVQLLIILPNAK